MEDTCPQRAWPFTSDSMRKSVPGDLRVRPASILRTSGLLLMTTAERRAISESYRHALLVFLETAMAGSQLRDRDQVTTSTIEQHVQITMTHVFGEQLHNSRYLAIVLWPIIIAGSCLVQEELRVLLSGVLLRSKYSTWNSVCASQLLNMLWEDTDSRVFGPYGLHLTIQRRGINYCLP